MMINHLSLSLFTILLFFLQKYVLPALSAAAADALPPAVLNWFSWWTNLSSWNVKHGAAESWGPHKITNLFFWSVEGRFKVQGLGRRRGFFGHRNRNRIERLLLTEVTFFSVSLLGSLLNITMFKTCEISIAGLFFVRFRLIFFLLVFYPFDH